MLSRRFVTVAASALAVGGVVLAPHASKLTAQPTVQAAAVQQNAATTAKQDGRFVVIGHRGASGYRPEHPPASYELATGWSAKDQVIPLDATGRLGRPTALVQNAPAAGLVVHPYTFRVENNFLPLDFRKSAVPSESRDLPESGIDALFSDNADIAVAVRTETALR